MSHELKTHDVVEVTIDGITERGVIDQTEDPAGFCSLVLPYGHDLPWKETDTLYVDGREVIIANDEVEFIGHPDTNSIHPLNYELKAHLDRL